MWKHSLAFIKMICVSIKERFKIYDVTEFDVIPRRALLLSKLKYFQFHAEQAGNVARVTSQKPTKCKKFAFDWQSSEKSKRK